MTFPSCWDGRLDTEDMAADPHVVYPSPGWAAGVCPESHNKRLPTVFFEALFRPGGVYQPGDQLYYSFNDTTGYGFHGDFFNGWQDGLIDVSAGNGKMTFTINVKVNVNVNHIGNGKMTFTM